MVTDCTSTIKFENSLRGTYSLLNTSKCFSLSSENDGCEGIPDMLDDDDDNDGRADLTEDRDCDGISRWLQNYRYF